MSAEQKNILQCRLANLRKQQIEIVHWYGAGDCKDCQETIFTYAHYLAVLSLSDYCEDSYLSCPKITGEVCVQNEEVSDGFELVTCSPTITIPGPEEPSCENPTIEVV